MRESSRIVLVLDARIFFLGLLGFLCPGVFLDFPSTGCKNLFLGLVVRKSTNCYPSELHIHRTKFCAFDVVERG